MIANAFNNSKVIEKTPFFKFLYILYNFYFKMARKLATREKGKEGLALFL